DRNRKNSNAEAAAGPLSVLSVLASQPRENAPGSRVGQRDFTRSRIGIRLQFPTLHKCVTAVFLIDKLYLITLLSVLFRLRVTRPTQRTAEARPKGAKGEIVMTLTYRTATVDGLKVFYRTAGDPKHPALLLLHGFPTSSHMFRDLIPALADRYHVVAPDLPGFGFTDAPDRGRFKYSFEHLTDVIDRFTEV